MSQFATPKTAILITPFISLAVGVTGVLFLGWDWREMVVFYWLYNFTAGILALIAIAHSDASVLKRRGSDGAAIPANYQSLLKLGMGIFFTFHYGIFTLVHGIFVFALVNGEFGSTSLAIEPFDVQPLLLGWLLMTLASIITALFMPLESKSINHVVSEPYKRIVVLHVAIISGAFILAAVNLPALLH